MVLHTIELASTGEMQASARSTCSSDANYVLSVRRRSERGFHDVRTRSEREPDLLEHGPGFVLYALMDAVVDRYFPVLDAIEIELEAIEERMFARRLGAREHRIAVLR